MIGLSITGMVLHDSNFPTTFISFNVSNKLDNLNQPQGTLGKLSYNSNMPQMSYVHYWAIGLIGSCPTNFN